MSWNIAFVYVAVVLQKAKLCSTNWIYKVSTRSACTPREFIKMAILPQTAFTTFSILTTSDVRYVTVTIVVYL